MSAMFHRTMRWSQTELSDLDQLVHWERIKGPVLSPQQLANRTSVVKALIARELLRLSDESAKISDRLAVAHGLNYQHQAVPESNGETPKQRKTRLQRERRNRAHEMAG